MLDTIMKALGLLLTSPLWMPILRSMRDQLREIEAQEVEREQDQRVGTGNRFRNGYLPPTFNEDLAEETYQDRERSSYGFRDDAHAPGGLRRAG